MLQTRNAIEYRAGIATAIAPSIVGVDTFAEESNERRRLAAERALDEVLADSFPASDPPSWNPGIVRPALQTLDVSRASRGDRTFLHALVSLAGAAGITLLVPFVILLVGLPVVGAIRGVLEVISWLFGA